MKDDSSTTCDRAHRRARGQVLPLLAFGIAALLGMVALGVDVGYWRYEQRLEQSAADSAAVAGDIQLFYPTTTSAGSTAPLEVTNAAQKAASDNGFTDDGGAGNTIVTVNSPPVVNTPPTAGATPYPSNSAVEVIVKKKVPSFVAGIFGKPNAVISARAVAAKMPRGNNCIYQLDPNNNLQMVPPGYVGTVSCGINVSGGIPSGTVSAQSLTYSGVAPTAGLVPPLVAQKGLPGSDPCLTIAGCAYLQKSTFPPQSGAVSAASQSTLNPGVYTSCCAGTVSLAPGVYYFYGGIVGGTITGTGVTIVNVNGSVTFGGHDGMNITAPSTGPTAGVAFYQPPSNSGSYTGNGNPGQFAGLFYAPSATYQTNGDGDTFSLVVVGGTNMTGNKALTVNPGIVSSGVQQAEQPMGAALSE